MGCAKKEGFFHSTPSLIKKNAQFFASDKINILPILEQLFILDIR